ncbi:MAG: hypothetical protein A3I44_02630 [Candidatus Sungbacteria bacterium RIFCSPLOWO2_02_FULL_51_17]|nr:MAG: hypothetical protein A3B29_00885 [Candidatus Sungbacteria bacterium RIFCSPLOWO2_01_FULL_51_34]OHA11963.1 MAG: hypothetical protein A3I44_02630 [Candidatus Sungbacteria bacterium RIFCSPLOWO2_02_FULL_51_17]
MPFENMATDLLKNIRTRIELAGEIGKLPDWYVLELTGFKRRWSTDMIVDLTDPADPTKTKAQAIKVVRVQHRTPDNRWVTGGGERFHPDVTLSQMESHAIEMSFKDWIFGIPHGGSKGGAAFDPRSVSEKDLIAIVLKIVSEAIEENILGPYIDRWAPDVNTNEKIMKWAQDHYAYEMRKRGTPQPAAAFTGKPVEFGGMPGRREATGRGLHYALQTFRKELKLKLSNEPTVVLQGFGNVGYYFAKLAPEFGIKIVGVQDQYGGFYHPNFDLKTLFEYVDNNPRKTVAGFHEICKGDPIATAEELFSRKADIGLPAAMEEAIPAKVAEKFGPKVLLEGANGPTLPESDPILEDRGVLVIPDIYANAGGVTVSYFEWEQDTHIQPFDPALKPPKEREEGLVFAALQSAFSRNGKGIIDLHRALNPGDKKVTYRLASYLYAMKRVLPIFAMKRRKPV